MKTRTEIINEVIKDNGYETYLEIGLGDGSNFKSVNVSFKQAIDPELKSSEESGKDDYSIRKLKFDSDDFFKSNEDKFDLIFIDGDHNAEQVEKDIVNAYSVLNTGGMILVHDVNPPSKEYQEVPRPEGQESWTGNAWRCVVGLKENHPKVKVEYIPEKYGILAIHKGRAGIKEGFTNWEMEYDEFEGNKQKLLIDA